MNKEKLREYLETKLNSHRDDIMDGGGERKVWITDVIDVVEEFINKETLPFDKYHEFQEWLDREGWYEASTHEYDNSNEPNSAVRLSIEELYHQFIESNTDYEKIVKDSLKNNQPIKCIWNGNEYNIRSINLNADGNITSVRLVVFDGEDFDFPDVKISEINFI